MKRKAPRFQYICFDDANVVALFNASVEVLRAVSKGAVPLRSDVVEAVDALQFAVSACKRLPRATAASPSPGAKRKAAKT